MIKINLAPELAYQLSGVVGGNVVLSPELFKKELIKRIGMVFLPVALLYVLEMVTIPELESELMRKQGLLSELTEFNAKKEISVQEIKKFQEDEKKIQQKISVIESISKERLNEVKFLDFLQQVIPPRLWLSEINMEKGKVKVSGYAISDNDISVLFDSLSKSIFLSNVVLVSSQEEKFDEASIKNFNISANLELQQ